HTNDPRRLPVQVDRRADHARAPGEMSLPVAVAQDRDVVLPRRILLAREGAADRRKHAHDPEEVGGYERHVEPRRAPTRSERHAGAAVPGERLEVGREIAILREVLLRESPGVEALFRV